MQCSFLVSSVVVKDCDSSFLRHHRNPGRSPTWICHLAEPEQDQTTFFPVRVFAKLAEASQNVKNGVELLVDGSLDISEYTDNEGQKRMSFRVLADAYRLL